MSTTRDRLLTEGLRLFGEQGYASTTIAQIEAAAGLSAGSGSLYKHFRSKRDLLAAGLERLLGGGKQLTEQLRADQSTDVAEQLTDVVRAGLRRLDEDRDLSRLLFRGLDAFPDLLDRFGEAEIARFHREAAAMLADLRGDGRNPGKAEDDSVQVDWSAVAVVLQGAPAHYWLMTDLLGEHPTGVDEDRFVAAAGAVTAALLRPATSTGTTEAIDGNDHTERGTP
jgi:AcrR family transcriptional regulator